MQKNSVILGSASPRRLNLLARLGLRISVVRADVEEIHDESDPVRTVTENAHKKHLACRKHQGEQALITADTVVYIDNRTLGKPASRHDAIEMLMLGSDRSQTVLTGVALSMPDGPIDIRCEASSVHFRVIDRSLATRYLDAARTEDRAGAYDINTRGEMIIATYSGSYSNIMGLPLGCVADWLTAHGHALPKKTRPLRSTRQALAHD